MAFSSHLSYLPGPLASEVILSPIIYSIKGLYSLSFPHPLHTSPLEFQVPLVTDPSPPEHGTETGKSHKTGPPSPSGFIVCFTGHFLELESPTSQVTGRELGQLSWEQHAPQAKVKSDTDIDTTAFYSKARLLATANQRHLGSPE